MILVLSNFVKSGLCKMNVFKSLSLLIFSMPRVLYDNFDKIMIFSKRAGRAVW